MKNRRDFLQAVIVGGAAAMAYPAVATAIPRAAASILADADDPWSEVPKILARIKAPVFPKQDFDIVKFGAVANNKTDNTDAIAKAIAACSKAGGGRVLVPKGEFITGAIHLKSNVNLHLNEGSTLRFTRDTSKYPLVFTRWEGTELMNYSSFIYAFEQENIAVTGSGVLDGDADEEHWWDFRTMARGKDGQPGDRERLVEMGQKGVPVRERVFGPGHYLRPQFFQPVRCKNVQIEGVTLQKSPMWNITPALCTNVIIRNLKINGNGGPNTDGCDPESCTDVLVENCWFNTGDDCIAIKSGRNNDGRRVNVPTKNMIIRGCKMVDGHGGVTIGSEISGGVSNIFAENCEMSSPNLDFAVRIKNNAQRGGLLEHIYARNITVGQVKRAAITIDFYYEEGPKGDFTPIVRNVRVENLTTKKADYALYLRGFDKAPIMGLEVVNCDFEGVTKGNLVENVKNLVIKDSKLNGKPMESGQTA